MADRPKYSHTTFHKKEYNWEGADAHKGRRIYKSHPFFIALKERLAELGFRKCVYLRVLGVDNYAVHRILKHNLDGKTDFKLLTAVRLCKKLGLSLDKVFGLEYRERKVVERELMDAYMATRVRKGMTVLNDKGDYTDGIDVFKGENGDKNE